MHHRSKSITIIITLGYGMQVVITPMGDGKRHIPDKFSIVFSFPLSSNRKLFFLWSIVICFLIFDTSFSNVGNLVSTSSSEWKLYLFLSISTVFLVGQFFILRFVRQKSLALETKFKLNLEIIYKVVCIVQYTIAAILLIAVLQILLTSYYSEVLLILNIMLGYLLGVSMMLLTSSPFFVVVQVKKKYHNPSLRFSVNHDRHRIGINSAHL